LAFLLFSDGIQLGVRLRNGHARPQPAQYGNDMIPTFFVGTTRRERSPKIDPGRGARVLRRNAYDHAGYGVHQNISAHNGRVTAVPLFPKALAQDGKPVVARYIFFVSETAARDEADASQMPEIRRYRSTEYSLRLAVAGHSGRSVPDCGQGFEAS
jgi:hypothetical protein